MDTQSLTKEEIQLLRDVSIHSLLNIRNNGRVTLIRCPFHNDRTPSCAIYPDNGFHCFACGKHGNNAIDFYQASGLSFIDACIELSKIL